MLSRFWCDEYFFNALLKILSRSLMFGGNVVCTGNAKFDYIIQQFDLCLKIAREIIRNLLWFLTLLMVMFFICVFLNMCRIHPRRGRGFSFFLFFLGDILSLDKCLEGIRFLFKRHHICVLHMKKELELQMGFNSLIRAHKTGWFTGILCNSFLRITLHIYTTRFILCSQQLSPLPIETNAPSPRMSFKSSSLYAKVQIRI